MNNKENKSLQVKPFKRILIVAFTSMAVLLTAGSCSIPGFNQRVSTSYGVLKKDSSVSTDRFGRINNVRGLDGNIISGGLGSLSGVRLVSVSDSKLLYLTEQKGLFLTEDGGRVWERKYIFPIGSDASDQSQRDQEIRADVALNDRFVATDVKIDLNNSNKWIVSGSFNGIGKIYKTEDNGLSFKEVYSEVENDVSVNLIAINPRDSNMFFGVLEGGTVISSTDNGSSWRKLNNFDDEVVSLGFRSSNSNLIYVLYEDSGLFVSSDFGATWTKKLLSYVPTNIEGNQFDEGETIEFRSFQKIIPVNSQNEDQWLMIADAQLWYTNSFDVPFEKLVLPLQNESYNLLDVEADIDLGLSRIYASVDNKLFVTANRGLSWSTSDMINITSPIGNIGEIVIPSDKKDNMYLMLVDPNASSSGFF